MTNICPSQSPLWKAHTSTSKSHTVSNTSIEASHMLYQGQIYQLTEINANYIVLSKWVYACVLALGYGKKMFPAKDVTDHSLCLCIACTKAKQAYFVS